MRAFILDTETTGIHEPEVIELGWMGPIDDAAGITAAALDQGTCRVRFRPSKPISLGAMATHHILDEELVDELPWPGHWEPQDHVQYLVGHNIDFDWTAIGSPARKRICTLALARSLWPELDSHTLGALTYQFVERKEARDLLRNAHSAGQDVELCGV